MKKIIQYLLFSLIFISCQKDLDDEILPFSSKNDQIKDFIWKNMNIFYLWQEQVPDLADTRFESSLLKTNSLSGPYNDFLRQFSLPRNLFNHLKHKDDRFSFLVEDYRVLEQSFKGIYLSLGFEFSFIKIDNSDNVAVLVQYVIPNSDAERNALKRGDFILEIDGEKLNTSNYRKILENNPQNSFKIYKYNQNYFVFDKEINIKREILQENPIFLYKIIEKDTKKIGYLVYNSFVSDFDLQLNEVFGKFKQENISELVLDLRYNSGGSVNTASYLASMITGDFQGKPFVRYKTNPKIKHLFEDKNFENSIKGTPINSLHLKRLFVIGSNQTASASELIINGLRPYIEVIHIGNKSVGKNSGSITIKDYIDDKGNVNPEHFWALQPLVFKSENAQGFSDYENGLSPQIFIKENSLNMGILGDENEPLLNQALQQILGQNFQPLKTEILNFEILDFSKNNQHKKYLIE